jgi:hypothetical protein
MERAPQVQAPGPGGRLDTARETMSLVMPIRALAALRQGLSRWDDGSSVLAAACLGEAVEWVVVEVAGVDKKSERRIVLCTDCKERGDRKCLEEMEQDQRVWAR